MVHMLYHYMIWSILDVRPQAWMSGPSIQNWSDPVHGPEIRTNLTLVRSGFSNPVINGQKISNTRISIAPIDTKSWCQILQLALKVSVKNFDLVTQRYNLNSHG